MGTYVMLTKLSPEALKNPESVTRLNKQVEDRIKKDCPGVKWLANYAVLGPCDYLDIFEAPDTDTQPRSPCWFAPSVMGSPRRGSRHRGTVSRS
jgi:uncharacterized protein with GYD domain